MSKSSIKSSGGDSEHAIDLEDADQLHHNSARLPPPRRAGLEGWGRAVREVITDTRTERASKLLIPLVFWYLTAFVEPMATAGVGKVILQVPSLMTPRPCSSLLADFALCGGGSYVKGEVEYGYVKACVSMSALVMLRSWV